MIITQVNEKVFEARIEDSDLEDYDAVVEIMKSDVNDVNRQEFMRIMTPVFNEFLQTVINEYDIKEAGGSDVGFILEGSTIIIVAKFFDGMGDLELPDAIKEILGALGVLGNGYEIDEDDYVDCNAEIVDEYLDKESYTSYFVFASMSEAINFCHIGAQYLKGSSVLYKVVDTKSPVLKDKYILEAVVGTPDEERHLREFVSIINKDVGFSTSVIEHCETVIKYDAVKKLAQC